MSTASGDAAVGVYATANLPQEARSSGVGLGATASGGVALLRPLYLEADLTGLQRFEGAIAGEGVAGLRIHLTAPFEAAASLSLFGGGGVWLSDGMRPVAAAAVAVDLPTHRGLAPRLGLGWRYAPVDSTQAVVLSLGVAYSPAARQRAAVVATPRAPARPAPTGSDVIPAAVPSLSVPRAPPGTMVWLPHPVCEWVPLAGAGEAIDGLVPPVDMTVYAPGFLPATIEINGPAVLTLQPAPRQGNLIIVAAPGDRVEVAGAPVPLGEDAVGLVRHRAGEAVVEITGGGRHVKRTVDVEPSFATWVRAGSPQPWTVMFEQGSAELTSAARSDLDRRIGLLGEARLRVVGSYSQEGDPAANLALAQRRAEAVRAWLARRGVAPNRVEVGEPAPPAVDVAFEAQRVAFVQVLAPVAP